MSLPRLELDVRAPAAEKILSSALGDRFAEDTLDEVGAMLINRIRTRFLSEQDPDGNPWVPSRAAIRRRQRGGTGTLFDTGRLFHSIQLAGTGPNERRIMTDVPYAATHQLGLNGMIRREFLGFSEEDHELAAQLIGRRVQQQIAKVQA